MAALAIGHVLLCRCTVQVRIREGNDMRRAGAAVAERAVEASRRRAGGRRCRQGDRRIETAGMTGCADRCVAQVSARMGPRSSPPRLRRMGRRNSGPVTARGVQAGPLGRAAKKILMW